MLNSSAAPEKRMFRPVSRYIHKTDDVHSAVLR